MRILHYYWTQYDDTEKPGGGVRVYLNNIVGIQKKEHEIYVLNSGIDYDLSGECHIKYLKTNEGIKQFAVFNSPMLAPSKCSFNNQDVYLNNKELTMVIKKFLKEQGNFDVIHFHSLEGLTLDVLTLKEVMPNTKFILSLHNYYPFCPQVNLWKNDVASCDNSNCGQDCLMCVPNLPNGKMVKLSYLFSNYLKTVGLHRQSEKFTKLAKSVYNKFKTRSLISEKNDTKLTGYIFNNFRVKNVEYINKYFDKVVCVSKRVKDIAVQMGVAQDKCEVIYIGTKFAEKQLCTVKYPVNNHSLRIIYMGYMRRDKGFYFFVDALEAMKEDIASKIDVVIAARFDDMELVEHCKTLRNKFKEIVLYDGYTHTQIPEITKNVNLGVVPVMWEDNLPQVSMELKSMGIPVLASDKGGASELTSSVAFRFRAGDVEDFSNKIKNILNGNVMLNQYYDEHFVLKTMEEHCEEINRVYGDR